MRPTREMRNRPLLSSGLGTTIEGADRALDDLTDVDVSSTPPADGDALVWDAYIGEWVPGAAAAALTVEDGTTSVSPVDTIVFDGATVTDDTGGQVTVAVTGGGGGGSGPFELDYVALTSFPSVTATTEAGATTIVTGNAVTYDGSTTVLIDFFVPEVDLPIGTAADGFIVVLYDGSSSIGWMAFFKNPDTADTRLPLFAQRRLTPTAGAHTYSIRGYVTNAARPASPGGGAGGSGNRVPGFIRITRASTFLGASYSTASSQSITSGAAAAIVDYGTAVISSGAVTTGASWKYTAPEAGKYDVTAAIAFAGTTQWAAPERGSLQLFKNGTLFRTLDRKDNYGSANSLMYLHGSSVIDLAAADYIDIRLQQNSGSSLGLAADDTACFVDIAKL